MQRPRVLIPTYRPICLAAGAIPGTGFPSASDVVWGIAHVYFLIGLRNRIAVAFSWLWDYVTFGRRARLITSAAPLPGPTLHA
jgi:NADH dehydrogenase